MKKSLLCLFLLTGIQLTSLSQVVSVQMEKTFLQIGDEISFAVKCLSEQDLEITVFTEGHLVNTQKAILPAEENPFRFPSADCPAGKYFILVTGNGIHVEQEFQIFKKK